MGYSITQVKVGRKTVWYLKQHDKVIAKGNTKQSVAKVLAFILNINL